MRLPKDRTRLMWVLLAAFVLLMVLAAASCLHGFGYKGNPYATGLLEGQPRWSIRVRASELWFHYGYVSPPEGFFYEESSFRLLRLPQVFDLRPTYARFLYYDNVDCTGACVECLALKMHLLPLALLCLVLWAFLFRKQRQRRRLLAWLASGPRCQSCDYNLTGNTSGTCPECGTPIPDEVKEEIQAPPAGGCPPHIGG